MNFQPIFQANRRSTERMRQIVDCLSETELSQSLRNDWTIAVTLAHLAFWDQRVIYVIELARKNNALQLPHFDDPLNDILAPLLSAIPPVEAARLAISKAETLDGMLEKCAQEFLEEMMKVNNRLVERALHRNDHLDDIEAILK